MAVALAGVVFFALLLAGNWLVCRSVLYPGVALAGIWLLEFVAQVFAHGTLYPVSWGALLVFMVGGLCFSAAAAVAYRGARARAVAPKPISISARPGDTAILWMMLVLLLVGLPLFVAAVRQFTSASIFSPAFFMQVRQGTLEQAAITNRAPLVNNLVVLSTIFALVAYAITDGARRQRVVVWALIGLAVAYNLMTAAKASAVTLIVALYAVHVMLRGRLPKRFLIGALGGILVLFGAVTVGRVEAAGTALTAWQSVAVTWRQFLEYFAASPVGFSIYLSHPDWVPPVWSPWRFFMRTANYFGNYFVVPDLNARFVNVGLTDAYNTYTAYFSYFGAYGMTGVICFSLFIGVFCTYIYKRINNKNVISIVLYGLLFHGVLMTIFNENLMLGLNLFLKAIVISWLVSVCRRMHRRDFAADFPANAK